ncbi:MAG: hypothetical protein HN593_06715 [Lentimicrobiaceae bacterium]|jgi:hypothetical protein|nr:hypothetical protein [Lentimicrobiaceae bacterium]
MMKNWLKVFLFAGIVGLAAIAYMWFFMYNKPHTDYDKATPDFIISANECYNHFYNGQESPDKAFTGKVLQLHGFLTSVDDLDSTAVIVFTYNEGMFGDEGIRCTLLPTYKDEGLNFDKSKSITIKGFCSGYNDTDVILEHCSIIN